MSIWQRKALNGQRSFAILSVSHTAATANGTTLPNHCQPSTYSAVLTCTAPQHWKQSPPPLRSTMTTTTIATDSEAQWPAQCWKQKDSGSHTNISINMKPTTSTFRYRDMTLPTRTTTSQRRKKPHKWERQKWPLERKSSRIREN